MLSCGDVTYRTSARRDGDAADEAPPTRVLRLERGWWQLGHTRLELDFAMEEIRATPMGPFGATPTLTWPARKVERAEVMLDDEAADALALVVDGEPRLLASGSKDSCDAAVVAIDRFLLDLRKARAGRARLKGTSNAPFEGFGDLEDESKWERLEAFFARVEVDERRLERSDDDLVLHAKKGGFSFRLQLDALEPTYFEIELVLAQSFVVTELAYDPARSAADDPARDPTRERIEGRTFLIEGRTFFGAHVYTIDDAAAFRLMPEELRAKICATMAEANIGHLRFGRESTELSCSKDLRELQDPAAHVARVVDLLVECARFLTTGSSAR
jgi:hypothetical protein